MPCVSYLLPFRSHKVPSGEFTDYVNALSEYAEVLLVDASPPPIFTAAGARCVHAVRHVAPDADLASLTNGKVRGVLTGLRLASHEAVVIADDDVRHTRETLDTLERLLGDSDIVRPQNYFDPLPWHARLDTGRILINRMTGGDWPGTLAVRRSTLLRSGGYDGNVLFENLELVRTVEAVGGRSVSAPDLFVRRLPPETPHFWGQRVRQAYDEFARPLRLICGTVDPAPAHIGVGSGTRDRGLHRACRRRDRGCGGGTSTQRRQSIVSALDRFLGTVVGYRAFDNLVAGARVESTARWSRVSRRNRKTSCTLDADIATPLASPLTASPRDKTHDACHLRFLWFQSLVCLRVLVVSAAENESPDG
jgi:hypothetical protein